jgi:hypothetical protein
MLAITANAPFQRLCFYLSVRFRPITASYRQLSTWSGHF